ncbi:Phenolphthiocerol synthesis polyketide synthase type I Pks15/1 [Aquisphaera giovannonii]|uniref:Phenolphthiocerol synthesis polyketide synthase type I Pks15/1 n=1 Tax=Aquisphaera giovannonii TaxID=406548 RepID=A0A5B9WAP0_9BACT|nr:Phenolphthiocerol synthesis polyketide synthase type I Pks15/1 [Aquisphaera giovannonii]
MGCLFPKADDLEHFWSNIRGRLDAITEVPPTHWRPEDYWDADPKAADRTYARRGGFLTPVDFPLLDFGMNPHALEATDTTQLLGLLVARRALEDAGYGAGRPLDRDRVSVILGVTGTLELVIPLGARLGHPIWRRALRDAGVDEATAGEVVRRISGSYPDWQENSFPGLLGNVAAGRIANKLDLGGTNCVVDAACASSLGAVNLALLELASGRCDVALSGGLDTFNDIFMYMCFSKTPALSPTGDARPFDAASDGTILGEGLGILVLKRLEDARRDGDRIYAVIRSMGTSSDGKGQAVYAPSAAGQVKALKQAYELAGISPASIELVEAHGTGTKVGDAIELEALEQVFRGARDTGSWCALGSVKSQVGHTKAAAGAAGLIKAAMALHRKVLPPTIKVKQPIGPLASGSSPFYLNAEPRPWLAAKDGEPRRAAVSAFGFGGSNYHCVLEEADPAPADIDWGGDVQILAYSAGDAGSLVAGLPRWSGDVPWGEVRAEGARSRGSFRVEDPHRVVLVATRGGTSPSRLVEVAATGLNERGRRSASSLVPSREVYYGRGPAPGGIAVLFPGQGAQYVGMFRDLACRFPNMQDSLALWDRMSGGVGPRIADAIYPPSAFHDDVRRAQQEALRDTRLAQPAIGAVSAGLLHILQDFGLSPSFAAGHSFGELTALHASGRIDMEALAKLSWRRGALMADCADQSDPGSMLAVLAPAEEVAGLIRRHGLDVVIANRNAPRQCVLSGSGTEIDRAARLCDEARLTARRLAVSAAFHSGFVARAEGVFREDLASVPFTPATMPVFANSTGRPYPDGAEESRELLAGQLSRPVEFVELIRAMHREGARAFLEVGPDAKLTGLVRMILEEEDHLAIATDQGRGDGPHGNLVDLAAALANLAAIGYPLTLTAWDGGYEPPASSTSRRGPTVKVCGANPMPRIDTPAPMSRTIPAAPAPKPLPTPEAKAPEPIMQPQSPHPSPGTNGHAGADLPFGRPVPAPRAASTGPAGMPVAALPAALPGTQPVASSLAEAIRQTQDSLIGLQRLAEQTATLHRQFLEGQAESQKAFQSLFEHQQRLTLAALHGVPAAPPADRSTEPASVPVVAERFAREAAPPAIKPAPTVRPLPSSNGHRADVLPAPSIAATVVPDPVLAPPVSAGIAGVLVEVVSEKTGYPAEMLELTMQLDADLGIDSIKRVEILSALQDRLPGSPAVGPEHLGELRTLGQIAEFLGEAGGESAGPPAKPSPTAQPVAAAGVAAVLVEVVSEKTGYPAEMLDLTMQLDADLGIDSIKRVEILSALQDRLPGSPAVGPEHLGELRTLGQIVEFLGGADGESAGPPAKPSPTAQPVAAAGVAGVLVEVVSEKTGYPAEMLELTMQLDADLGIDSIKRVEILSALQDRLPGSPAVGPEHLGELRTLGQIAEFLGGAGGESAGPPPGPAPTAQPAINPTHAAPPVHEAALDLLAPRAVPLGDMARETANLSDGAEIWVTDDGSYLASSLAAGLSERGFAARVVRVDGGGIADVQPELGGLVVLSPAAGATPDFIRNAFRLIQQAGPGLRAAAVRGGAVLVGVTRLDGEFALGGLDAGGDPGSGALAGLVKTAQSEWPEVSCKVIDLGEGASLRDDPTGRLIEEFLRRGPLEVGLGAAGTSRIDLVPLEEKPPRGGSTAVNPGDVVVISGGARGITAEVAVELASSLRPRIVLLGRTPEPEPEPEWLASCHTEEDVRRSLRSHSSRDGTPQALASKARRLLAGREVRATLERIRAAGSEVRYHRVDVRDRAAVAECLRRIQAEWGPVRGLIHGAGVLADRRIEDQTATQFADVFDTKAEGLNALVDSLEVDSLRFLAAFSSSTARFGRRGQVAYAAANEWLNKWCQRAASRLRDCRVVAFNWGPWAGGMVTESLRSVFEHEGLGLIPLRAGARLLVEEIQAGAGRPVEIVVLARPGAVEESTGPAAGNDHNGHAHENGHRPNGLPAKGRSGEGMLDTVFERKIDERSIPVIRSHVIDGHAVLPMALIMEWLAEGALHRNPGLAVSGVDELKLLKGIILQDHRPAVVSIRAGKKERRGDSLVVPVEMHGSLDSGRNVIHAKASVVLADSHPRGEARLAEPTLRPLDLREDEVYHKLLFHGPAMQALRRLEGGDDRCLAAQVATSPAPSAWMERPLRQTWLTDPLAVDAAFQLVVLWTRQHLGANSLPTSVGAYRQFRRSFPRDGVRVLVAVREASRHRAVADIEFTDADGGLVARIDAYECVVDASLNQAFRRNRLPQLEVASS